MFNKVIDSADEAINDIVDGSSIAVGGFGLVGVPNVLITALLRKGSKNLSIVSNNCGVDGGGLGILLEAGRIRHVTASYIGTNKEFERQYLSGLIELELTPQGNLAERIRAAGAGIGGFFSPTGYGTLLAEGKETRLINGRHYVLESPIHADYALIKALKADRWGNLVYRKAARNFGPIMAMAAKCTIAQVDEVVALGELDPEVIITPGIFVKRVVQSEGEKK
jgi:3-oxoadipate CoA-transferase alpha subunit